MYMTVATADGELVGEDGASGHGRINQEKAYEVPFGDGKRR
jgi:hypothetical protein